MPGVADPQNDPVSCPSMTLVVPMWNEQDTAARAVRVARRAGDELCDEGAISSLEIVAVDDGSSDRTAAILDELCVGRSDLTVVRHARNRGLGAAVRSGLGAANSDVVVVTGADLPFDLLELRRSLRIMVDYDVDIVAPYRLDRTGEGPRRFLYSVVYNSLIRAAFGLRVRDVNFAAKLLRREVLTQVELRSEGSFLDVELLAKATRQGFRVAQFGVDYFPRTRGVSTLSSPAVIRTMLREMHALTPEIRAAGPRRG